MKELVAILSLLYLSLPCVGQQQDSPSQLPYKIHHAEPLYIDLIRDLGARKGEKEWNIGGEAESLEGYETYGGFVEYEFAPLNRLGLEVEVPFAFYRVSDRRSEQDEDLENNIESIKLAAQYTFLVSRPSQVSLALGYINHFVLYSFHDISQDGTLFRGNAFNPFFVAAKRWGQNFHSLFNTGPLWEYTYKDKQTEFFYQVNASVHYIIPNTQSFVGVEINQEFIHHHAHTVVRPQVKVSILSNLALGLVTGIPISSETESISGMFRLIYEPPGK